MAAGVGPVLRLSEASYSYSARRIIGPVTFDVMPGSVLGLIGSNGAGKTTLLSLLTGLLQSHTGAVEVAGEPVRLGRLPRSTSAMIEEPAFLGWATGWENLLVACNGHSDRQARMGAVLAEVGLADACKIPVSRYSQGMRQRLGIARALVADPEVLILDEPSNGLDPHGIRWLRTLVRERAAAGHTVVVSSHQLHEIQQVATHVAVMWDGRQLTAGPVAEILEGGQIALEDLYFQLLDGKAIDPLGQH